MEVKKPFTLIVLLQFFVCLGRQYCKKWIKSPEMDADWGSIYLNPSTEYKYWLHKGKNFINLWKIVAFRRKADAFLGKIATKKSKILGLGVS